MKTTGGVKHGRQSTGTIKVIREAEGDTLVTVAVIDPSTGLPVEVYLDYSQITQLMVALGREAADL